jgi:hypothetical protein
MLIGARASAPMSIQNGGGNRVNNSGARVNNSGARVNNSGNRTNVGNRVNTGDVNINRNVNVNGYDHGGDWDDHYHPVARGVAIGTAAAVTSAAIGSMIYSLPPACSPYQGSYYYCGGVYYQPQYQGDKVVYVVVQQP